MASEKTYLAHLRQVPLFAGCSTKELVLIAKAGDEVSVPTGHVICDQGQTGREAFVLLTGAATVRRNGKKVAELGPGAVLGELALLDHGPRTATAVTTQPSTLLVLEARRFSALVLNVPSVGHKMLAALAGRIRDLDRQIYG